MESITIYYDTPFKLPANGFTRTDEDGDSGFVGWNEEPTKDSYFKQFSDEQTVTENLVYRKMINIFIIDTTPKDPEGYVVTVNGTKYEATQTRAISEGSYKASYEWGGLKPTS